MKIKLQWILNGAIIGLGIGLALIFFSGIVFVATTVEKVTWCHTEPNGNQQTLELPQAALENAGHVDAQGNPLHAGDHPGECEEPTATPTPTDRPTPTPCPEDEEPSVTPINLDDQT